MCLNDNDTLQLLTMAADDFARAQTPATAGALMMATMTALQKKDGGVRGIATGTSFRRLVAKSLARQFSDEVESACSPFQFALSARAGTDCVAWDMPFAQQVMPTLCAQSVPSTELDRTTTCSEVQLCAKSGRFPDCGHC